MLQMNPTYLFGEFICLLILYVLTSHSRKQFRLLVDEKLFLEVMLTAMLMIISEIIFICFEGDTGAFSRIIDIFCMGFNLFFTGMVGFMWLAYVDFKLFHRQDTAFANRITLYVIPLVFLGVFLVFSQYYKLIYYIDEDNIYQRGSIYYAEVVISFIYAAYSAYISIREGFKQKRKHKRQERFRLAYMSFIPIFGGILQVIYDELPFLSLGVTLMLLLVCLNVQSKQVSLDTLTGINNRRQFNIYMESLLSNKKSTGKNLYMLVMDVDKFKHINDTYGHLEGDNALIKVAEALTWACDKNDDFVARYGGDEFVVICKRNNDGEVDVLKEQIKKAIDITNDQSSKDYKLSLSIGSAQFFKDGDTQESIMATADQKLYDMKHTV